MIESQINCQSATAKLAYSVCYNQPFIVAWWSAGITSAVACKMALELYENVELFYIKIDSAHPDNERFKGDCEKWYGKKIKTIQSRKFKDQFEVIEKTGGLNGAEGARCTLELKKAVRYTLEKFYEKSLFNNAVIDGQIFGFEFDRNNINRAIRFLQQYPATKPKFPLIEKGMDKNMCAGLLLKAGIDLPVMYKLGFSNNNCIGCVKGGKGYWNKIKIHFPETFDKMAKLERKLGRTCIQDCFLDTLKTSQGKKQDELLPDCGNICEVEFADIPDKNLELILSGRKSIYEVA